MRGGALRLLARHVRGLAAGLGVSVHDLLPMPDPTEDVRLPTGLEENWQQLSAADRRLVGALAGRLANE